MSEDQGGTKGQDKSDATVKADAASPTTPAALSDKELEKVAGGVFGGAAAGIIYGIPKEPTPTPVLNVRRTG